MTLQYMLTPAGEHRVARADTDGNTMVNLSSLLAGEDTLMGRLLTATGARVSASAITTNTSTLIQSGKTIFLGVWCSSAGTSWTATVRDNPTSTAGGTNKGPATTLAVGNPYQAILGEKGILCDSGLVIDTAGTTPGSFFVLYI